jgi:hypothetical protein
MTVPPHEPFTSKIRTIFVRTQRPPRSSFGAARHTNSFDRVNGDKQLGGLRLVCSVCTSTCESANPAIFSRMELWALIVTSVRSASAVAVSLLH